MRILYVVSGLGKSGGIEAFCNNVISSINLSKYQIDFLVNSSVIGELEPSFIAKGCNIYHINSSEFSDRIKERNEWFRVNAKNYDIAHIHTVLTTAFQTAKIAKKYGIKCVITHSHTASNYEGARWKNNLCRFLLNHYTDYRVACSKMAGEFLFGRKYNNRTAIIYNAVDTDKFIRNDSVRTRIREQYGLSNNYVVGHVGRLCEAKNHKFLLDTFAKVAWQLPSVKLILCGDGAYRERIESQIKSLNIDQNVIMLGAVENVDEIMNAFDIFVFPSLFEGLPTVLVEAQSIGIPIICSDRITSEVLVIGGIEVLPLEREDRWAAAIIKWQNADKNNNPLEEDLQLIAEKFGSKAIAEKLEQLYDTTE